jgi:glycine betaine/proline transport system ATP-binding protein
LSQTNAKIIVKDLYKIFGANPQKALTLIDAGKSKDEVHDLTGSVVAINNVSFTVGRGETFVVMGLSGSGKSTLVRCINRLIAPTSGSITVDDREVVGADEATLRDIRLNKVSMVFQHFALLPHRTVAENVEYGLKIKGVAADERRERALKALETVGLAGWGDVLPSTLSGGMRQRVGLARALAVDTEVLLMDEPFGALDPLIRNDMQQELITLQRDLQKTIIFISHDLHESLMLGDRIAIMRDGSFVQIGTPEEIVGNPADDYVSAFTKEVDRGRVFTVKTIMHATEPLVLGRDTVATALGRMTEQEQNSLYVIDDESRKPLGLVKLVDAARSSADDDGGLEALVVDDFPTATEGEHLIDIYDRCASGAPIAVVCNHGQLRGVVRPRDVLAELAAQ